jgi:hypothetical protein
MLQPRVKCGQTNHHNAQHAAPKRKREDKVGLLHLALTDLSREMTSALKVLQQLIFGLLISDIQMHAQTHRHTHVHTSIHIRTHTYEYTCHTHTHTHIHREREITHQCTSCQMKCEYAPTDLSLSTLSYEQYPPRRADKLIGRQTNTHTHTPTHPHTLPTANDFNSHRFSETSSSGICSIGMRFTCTWRAYFFLESKPTNYIHTRAHRHTTHTLGRVSAMTIDTHIGESQSTHKMQRAPTHTQPQRQKNHRYIQYLRWTGRQHPSHCSSVSHRTHTVSRL